MRGALQVRSEGGAIAVARGEGASAELFGGPGLEHQECCLSGLRCFGRAACVGCLHRQRLPALCLEQAYVLYTPLSRAIPSLGNLKEQRRAINDLPICSLWALHCIKP